MKKRLDSFVKKQIVGKSQKVSLNDIFALIESISKKRAAKQKETARIEYEKRMHKIAKDEKMHWSSVDFNLVSKSTNQNETAAKTLKELYDMALFFNKKPDFMEKFKTVLEPYRTSKAKLERIRKEGLPLSEL